MTKYIYYIYIYILYIYSQYSYVFVFKLNWFEAIGLLNQFELS